MSQKVCSWTRKKSISTAGNEYDTLDGLLSDDEGKKDIELIEIENGEVQKKLVA